MAQLEIPNRALFRQPEVCEIASIDSLEKLLRELKGHGQPVSTRTTIVLSTVFEKPGIVPVEKD